MSVLVGKPAPFFHDGSKRFSVVLGDGGLADDFSFAEAACGRYAVVYFYPLDFTFVCPSEIIAFHNRLPAFQERNTAVCAISVDSHFTRAT